MTPRSLIIDSKGRLDRALTILSKLPVDRAWELVIKPYDPKRSVDANRRLWALHEAASQATGHSADELHEFCKLKFMPHRTIRLGKDLHEVATSSARLSKEKFRIFSDQVEAFYISELGVFLGDE